MFRKGKAVEMLVSYDPSFTMMAEWFKQLFGESEGKRRQGTFPVGMYFLNRSSFAGTIHTGWLSYYI